MVHRHTLSRISSISFLGTCHVFIYQSRNVGHLDVCIPSPLTLNLLFRYLEINHFVMKFSCNYIYTVHDFFRTVSANRIGILEPIDKLFSRKLVPTYRDIFLPPLIFFSKKLCEFR